MKNLLDCSQPIYQLYGSVVGLAVSLCILLKEKSERLLAFSCPSAASPRSGLLDQNKLKRALWTLSIFNLRPLTHSDSFLNMFLSSKKRIHSRIEEVVIFLLLARPHQPTATHNFYPPPNILCPDLSLSPTLSR